MLTHLLGQNVEQLAEKLAIYRTAWRESGHPGDGHVTLMLHTFVGDDDDEVREVVREPMIEYLASALDLTEKAAWSFPAFKERASATGQTLSQMFAAESLTPEEKSAILNHAFERYFETSGLFGTVETCLAMVERLKGVGIDELACLIDFGVASSAALQHLEHLNRLRELAGNAPAPAAGSSAVPALIARHKVTHLQCTPSMATLLTADRESRLALRGLTTMLVGGEALSPSQAQTLGELVLGNGGQHVRAHGDHGLVVHATRSPAARPRFPSDGRSPTPSCTSSTTTCSRCRWARRGTCTSVAKGVARGYWRRPDLTADRFVRTPSAIPTDASTGPGTWRPIVPTATSSFSVGATNR